MKQLWETKDLGYRAVVGYQCRGLSGCCRIPKTWVISLLLDTKDLGYRAVVGYQRPGLSSCCRIPKIWVIELL